MERPKFSEKISKKDYIERTSDKPVKSFISGQAMDLTELIARFERGQRLNVHQNFRPMQDWTEGKIVEEDFDEAPPDDVHDVADVERYYHAHQQHKQEFSEKQKSKRSQQEQPKQAPQESETPPLDPAKS